MSVSNSKVLYLSFSNTEPQFPEALLLKELKKLILQKELKKLIQKNMCNNLHN